MLVSIIRMQNDCYQKFPALKAKHSTGMMTVGFVLLVLVAVVFSGAVACLDYLQGKPAALWLIAVFHVLVFFGLAMSFAWLAKKICQHASFRPLITECLAARLVFFLGYLLDVVSLRIQPLLKEHRLPPPLAPSIS